MGSVVKFKPDIDYYYTRGLNLYESDNYLEALKAYREAYKIASSEKAEDFGSVIEVEMACCYRSLNLMRETQLMYYKALSNSTPDSAFDSIIGLIDAFGASGNDDALKYYMDMAAKRGYGREMDFIDAATQFFSRNDYKVEPTPEEHVLDFGKRLLESGQYEFARQMLEMVPAGCTAYGEANAKLAVLFNASGEYEKALDCAQKALEYEISDRIETEVNKALALYKLGKSDEYNEIIEDISDADIDDVNNLNHLVRLSAILGNGELVLKFGRKLERISPLRGPMLCYAIALSNSGDLRSARKIMVTLQALYPYDAVIKIFARLISAATVATDFSLGCELPKSTENEILGELNSVLAQFVDDRSALKAALLDRDLQTSILLVLQAGSDNSKHILCDMVADIPFFENYMRDCLMDPLYPDADKRIILPVALRKFRKRPVWLTCRDVCRPLCGKAPSKIGNKWRDAYYLAYSTVALFGCDDLDKDFDKSFNKMYEVLGGDHNVDVTALAAVMANRIKKISPLNDDECCIELFGADKEAYFRYKNSVKTRKNQKL